MLLQTVRFSAQLFCVVISMLRREKALSFCERRKNFLNTIFTQSFQSVLPPKNTCLCSWRTVHDSRETRNGALFEWISHEITEAARCLSSELTPLSCLWFSGINSWCSDLVVWCLALTPMSRDSGHRGGGRRRGGRLLRGALTRNEPGAGLVQHVAASGGPRARGQLRDGHARE